MSTVFVSIGKQLTSPRRSSAFAIPDEEISFCTLLSNDGAGEITITLPAAPAFCDTVFIWKPLPIPRLQTVFPLCIDSKNDSADDDLQNVCDVHPH